MSRVLTTVVLLVLGHSPAVAGSGSGAGVPQTEQTVPVTRGARLTIENHAGEVIVRGSDRDAVRVHARHPARTRVAVRTVPSGVHISSSGLHGPAGSVDYDISVPTWMPIKIDGHFASIAVEGTESEVAAETMRGDIVIKGGAAFVSGKSVEGEVKVEGARGRITVSSINQGVSVTASTGDIVAETVNGPIRLTKIESQHVDAGTVNGHITFEGAAAARGKYRFSSHNGNIVVAVPESASAEFSVWTYNGTMNTNLPLQRGGEVGGGRRATYTLGSGSAEFELESFGGTIHLRRHGTLPSQANERREEEPEPDA